MYKLSQLNTMGPILTRSRTTKLQTVGHRLRTINTSANEAKPKSRFFLYTTSVVLTGVAGTAGVVLYSKYDPKFRELLTDNVPGSDKFIKVLLFEDTCEFVNQGKRIGGRLVCKIAQQIKSIKESIGGIGDKSEAVVNKSVEQIKSVTKSLPAIVPIISNSEEKKPKEISEPQQTISKQNELGKSYTEVVKPKFTIQEKPKPQELPPVPVVLQPRQYTIEELETEILTKSSLGVDALTNATNAIQEYSENVSKLIENAAEKIDPNLSVKLQQLEDKMNNIYLKSCEEAKEYRNEIIEKQKLLNNSKIEATPENLAKSIHRTNESLEELANASLLLENEEQKLSYIKKYKSCVNEAQASLIAEFESLFPGSDITQHKINTQNNDFDVFLLYALKKLNYFQDRLSKQEATLDRKVNNAMSADFLSIETINELNYRLNSEILKLDEQFSKQLNEFDVKLDEDLKEQLKAHTQAHADLVAKAVDFTKEEFENRVRLELSAVEKSERQKYQSQLDSLKVELQSVVNNLTEQAEKEKKLFANQAIWEAGEFLKSSLDSSDNEQPINVKDKINTIKNLGESDLIVKQVVSTVPSQALENGVLSKGQLKEDFNQVEKRIYQTALIPDSSFSLPLMAFSYLASLFVVRHSHISPNEVNNEEFDPSELNTYEIVERARYCIDRDNILQAVRYLNLLTGCSRVVAQEWMNEATVFLETNQAVDLLKSYATVSSRSAAHNA